MTVKRALVTVTNQKYLAGTEVLLFSFLKYNPNFQGDLIIIHDNLKPKLRKALTNKFPVKFEQVSLEMQDALRKLVYDCPRFSNKLQRFWSLELFRLKEYDQFLFLDSDILCKSNLDDLWKVNHEFSACLDLSYYNNKFRNINSFELTSTFNEKRDFEKTFNAGVMLYNPPNDYLIHYASLLNLLSSDTYKSSTSGHTDQYLLNHFFRNRVHWLSTKYNYLKRDEITIESKIGMLAKDAVLLHYIRNPKPWNFKRLIKDNLKGRGKFVIFEEWLRVYCEMLLNQKPLRICNLVKGLLLKVVLS